MQFEKCEKTKSWNSQHVLREREIEVRIHQSHPEDQLEEIAGEWLEQIDQDWRGIESNLAGSALEFYNEQWTNPDEGYPEMSSKQFLSKVFLQTVEVLENRGNARLLFNDSGLFGKHKVEIYWSEEKGMDDAIVVG